MAQKSAPIVSRRRDAFDPDFGAMSAPARHTPGEGRAPVSGIFGCEDGLHLGVSKPNPAIDTDRAKDNM
jgi:hypothetical protein